MDWLCDHSYSSPSWILVISQVVTCLLICLSSCQCSQCQCTVSCIFGVVKSNPQSKYQSSIQILADENFSKMFLSSPFYVRFEASMRNFNGKDEVWHVETTQKGCRLPGLNRRPVDEWELQSNALPTELKRLICLHGEVLYSNVSTYHVPTNQ